MIYLKNQWVDPLVRDLKATGLFATVEPASMTSVPGAFHIRPIVSESNCRSDSRWSLYSDDSHSPVYFLFGMPYLSCRYSGYHFTIEEGSLADKTVIDARVQVSFVSGLHAWPRNWFSSRTWREPPDQRVPRLRFVLLEELTSEEGATPSPTSK